MLFWIIVAIAAAVAVYAIVVFNRLLRTRQMVNEAGSGIDVQLKRRSDLVPNLVETCEGPRVPCRARLVDCSRAAALAAGSPAW
jgi:LemA protein